MEIKDKYPKGKDKNKDIMMVINKEQYHNNMLQFLSNIRTLKEDIQTSMLIQINIIQVNRIQLLVLMKLFVMDLLRILKNNLREFKKNM
jgi:hypothetical protein